jgi:hypothetical protein
MAQLTGGVELVDGGGIDHAPVLADTTALFELEKQFPTRSNSSTATSCASGAQLFSEKPGRLASSTRRFMIRLYSSTVRARPEYCPTTALTSFMTFATTFEPLLIRLQ